MTIDPVTLVYNQLWQILLASTDFCALVPAQNRIILADNPTSTPVIVATRHPEQMSRQALEYPQVIIEPAGGQTLLFRSSDRTSIEETFLVKVLTGDKRLCYAQGSGYNGLYPVKMAILQALGDWEATMKLLTWDGHAGFVHDCTVVTQQIQQGSPRLSEQNAPVESPGWNLAWAGHVEMWLPNTVFRS